MKFTVKHLLLVVIIVCIGLGLRSMATSMEDDRINGIGLLLTVAFASGGFALLNSRLTTSIIAGTLFAFLFCLIHSFELVYHSQATEYLRRDPTQAQYSDDPGIATFGTIVFTIIGFVVACISSGAVEFFKRQTSRRSKDNKLINRS